MMPICKLEAMHIVQFVDPAGSTRTGTWTDGRIEYFDKIYDATDVNILPPSAPSKSSASG